MAAADCAAPDLEFVAPRAAGADAGDGAAADAGDGAAASLWASVATA